MITWLRPLVLIVVLLALITRGGLWLTLGYLLLGTVWTRRELRKGPLRRPFMYSLFGIAAGFALWPLLTVLSLYEQGSLWWARGRYMVTDKNGDVQMFRWKTEALAFAIQNAQGGTPARIVDVFGHM